MSSEDQQEEQIQSSTPRKRNPLQIIGGTIWGLIKGFIRLHMEIFSFKNLFHFDNIGATLLVFLMFKALSFLDLSVLDPIGTAFDDTELTDVLYSQNLMNSSLRESDDGTVLEDSNIVIVNCGNLNRMQIAMLLDSINTLEPKVIGMDIFFKGPKEGPEAFMDMMLEGSMSRIDNLVLVSKGLNMNLEGYTFDSVETSEPAFNQHATNGLANMPLDLSQELHDLKVSRKFMTKAHIKSKDTVQLSFPAQVAWFFRPNTVKTLLARNSNEEMINYVGNISVLNALLPMHYDKTLPRDKPYFKAYEYTTFLEGMHRGLGDAFKGKIVLVGFLGGRMDVDEGEDKFFTPINVRYVGKTNKDMYGVVVHANSIHTILTGNYIDSSPNWVKHFLGVLMVFLTFAAYRPIYNDFKVWYDGVTKLMGFIEVIVILYIIGTVFATFHYEIRFGSIYYGCILLAGDFLELYYGLFKNVFLKIKSNL